MPNLAYYLSGCPANCGEGGGEEPPPTPVQQPALVLNGAGTTALLTHTMGTGGFVGVTVCGWFKIASIPSEAFMMSMRGAAGREAGIGANSIAFGASDNQGGTAGFDVNPPLDEYWFGIWRGTSTTEHDAFWFSADGVDSGVAHRVPHGIADSLSVLSVALNSDTGINRFVMEAQYIRAYPAIIADEDLAALRMSVDTSLHGGALWWNVFTSDGEGGVVVEDATGNARTFVITNGTITAEGPIVGDMP